MEVLDEYTGSAQRMAGWHDQPEEADAARKQLKPGTYRLVARYPGSNAFSGSTSVADVLTVFKPAARGTG